MLIAALDPRTGKIVQVALPGFDWGTAGAKNLAYVKHDDPQLETVLMQQVAAGGLLFVTYPYASYEARTGRMLDYSTGFYDLSKLSGLSRQDLADRVKDSPILDPQKDFVSPPFVKPATAVGTGIKGA